MRKFLIGTLAAFLCVCLITPTASALAYSPSFELSAQSVYMINLDNDVPVFQKDMDKRLQPDALAQLMTVILALENCKDPDNETTVMTASIQDDMYKQNIALGGIALAGLFRGEELSIRKLMYAVMLPGANEAAMMIANYISDGSVPKFVEMMNTRAKELGARNTNFTSPHGLPDSAAYTTAYDMYLIASHAMTLDGFSELLEKTSMDGGPTNLQETLLWVSTNKLIRQNTDYYNPSVTGIKNGYDGDNGSCMVSMAKRDGYSYMLVVMGCKAKDAAAQNADYNEAFAETNRLYDWAFDTYRVKTLLEKGKSFGELKLELTWGKDFIRLMSADNFTALLPKDVESSSIRFELDVPESVRAPVAKGDLIGSVRLILMDEEIGRVNVVSAETVEVSRALLLLDKVLNITKTFWFKFIVLFLILLILFYSVLTISKNRSRRRYSNRKKTRQ